MDGLDGASEAEAVADLFKGEIGLFGKEDADLTAVGVENDGLAAAAMMAGSDVASVTALLEELLDHAERHLETAGHLFTGDIAAIISLEDAMTEIHRNRCHGRIMAPIPQMATLLFKML